MDKRARLLRDMTALRVMQPPVIYIHVLAPPWRRTDERVAHWERATEEAFAHPAMAPHPIIQSRPWRAERVGLSVQQAVHPAARLLTLVLLANKRCGPTKETRGFA